MKYNPPYGITDPDGPYINGDPSIGRAGSIPPAESIEYPQREIVNLIADAARATPANTDMRQLAKAVQSQLLISDDDQGVSNQYQVTMAPPPGAYFKYMMVIMKIGSTNTGPTTLNVNAMGGKQVVHVDGSPLGAGELKANSITCFEYDGTNFQIAWSTGGQSGVSGEGANPGGPVFLTAPTDYYVNNATGNDSLYDGTTAAPVGGTSHGPYKTIQKACDQVPRYNLNGWSITIHVADGSYAAFSCRPLNGSGTITIEGNVANPAAVVVTGNSASAANFNFLGGLTNFRGFKLISNGPVTSPADPCACIFVSGPGTSLFIGAMEFGPCLAGSIVAQMQCLVGNSPANCVWKITGGASGGGGPFSGSFLTSFGASIGYNAGGGPAYQIPGAVGFNSFAHSETYGNIAHLYSSMTGAGNVSGARFLVQNLSLINTAGGGANYWPGSVAGTANGGTGGYYV